MLKGKVYRPAHRSSDSERKVRKLLAAQARFEKANPGREHEGPMFQAEAPPHELFEAMRAAVMAADPHARLKKIGDAIGKLPDDDIVRYARQRWKDAAAVLPDDGKFPEPLAFERFDRALEDARHAAREAVFRPGLIRDRDRQAGVRKPRRSQWAELDHELDKLLAKNPGASNKELWNGLPDSDDFRDFYVDGDKIYLAHRGKTLSWSGFMRRATKARRRRTLK